ncbi:MAG: polyprenyl synthetase family protein [Gammaproteobacteria bacterium]|nr:polyprenyl synthetase family protein [Gammaproteobacteria bacterium]
MLAPPRTDLKSLLAPIASDMAQVDAVIRQRLSSEVVLINRIGEHIIAAGGKRMRPAVVLLTGRALGCATAEPALLAAVVEFIHTATLLHDDVVDGADRRRGLATANHVFGNPGTVLSGDFLYSRAFQMMVDAGRMSVMRVLADCTNAIAQGEVLQLMHIGDPEVGEERYLRVIELKTARLFQAAAQLGAIAADADEPRQARIARYGYALGMAFQIVDDLLDYTAAPEVSGKSLGTDLAEGKPTLPLIHAMKHGNAAQTALIQDAIRAGRADRMREVLAAVESTGAIAYSAALAKRYAQDAISALGEVPDSPHKHALIGLARFAVERAH